jgi:DNA repair protein SbcD/Mre11
MALRFFHTADWHLGQQFHGFDRDAEHSRFLDWLLAQLVERRPDALVVSGDIFDSISPPASAQRRYYQFLARARAACPALQIVLTAGNHDSATRLEAPSDLLTDLGIHVVGTIPRRPDGSVDPTRLLIPLRSAAGPVEALVLAVPFLRPSDVPAIDGARDPYLEGIREFHRRLVADATALRDAQFPGAALIALGHCHLTGAEESRESERCLVIGGSEALGTDAYPAELSYVALGHLHKPQSLDGGRIRYSGSPIPLSFSERRYVHRVLEVSVADGRLTAVTDLPIPRTVSLQRIPESGALPLPQILPLLAQLPAASTAPTADHPFLEVQILDDGPDPTRRRQVDDVLRDKAARLTRIQLVRPEPIAGSEATQPAARVGSIADVQSLDPVALMASAHRERHGTDPSTALERALRELVANEAHEVQRG